ncbi:HAD family phosphatase [Pseudovibrio exalbescens]|uniref:HAD family hydrolase n=1 Tax=Pseudovibrio exalbescens TaxID=197461 RepID=UPI00236693DD|nr:HAD family phosphatase [Pseudovibrio exalbescens]MDD7909549.1 HAD family phosphatase [Pseudovibrio exalbescens]
MTPKLIIFDCDGILVDTEKVANEVLSGFIARAGLTITPDECHLRFTGRTLDTIRSLLIEEEGLDLEEDWADQVRAADLEAFQSGIEAIPGIKDVVEQVRASGIPYCVGSSGKYEKMNMTLASAGLLDYFKDVLYSAQDVPHGKPSPDIFLYAAKGMKVDPKDCIVIEDSLPGLQAARDAGMAAFGYVADPLSNPEKVRALGATPFERMEDLPALLGLPGA